MGKSPGGRQSLHLPSLCVHESRLLGLLDFVFDYAISGAGELFTYVIKRVGWFWGDGGGPRNATDVGPRSATCAPLRLLTPENELSAAQPLQTRSICCAHLTQIAIPYCFLE